MLCDLIYLIFIHFGGKLDSGVILLSDRLVREVKGGFSILGNMIVVFSALFTTDGPHVKHR